jgi:hypothetical protein
MTMSRFACLLVIITIAVGATLARDAFAGMRPEAHPSCHCKARITRHAYWYRTVWTASDGTPIYVSCRVARVTRCWIVRLG